MSDVEGLKKPELCGNSGILEQKKTAFLCSHKFPAGAVLRCYEWAIEQREKGVCVICGYHSPLEKDVVKYLLKGKQPLIIALARGLKKRIEPKFKPHIENGRLLIVSPFEAHVKRVTKEIAEIRNRFMLQLADEVVIGWATPGGQIERLLAESRPRNTMVLFNSEDNLSQ